MCVAKCSFDAGSRKISINSDIHNHKYNYYSCVLSVAYNTLAAKKVMFVPFPLLFFMFYFCFVSCILFMFVFPLPHARFPLFSFFTSFVSCFLIVFLSGFRLNVSCHRFVKQPVAAVYQLLGTSLRRSSVICHSSLDVMATALQRVILIKAESSVK
jgi:hypothetical protein